jgi:hypothetical protein
MTHVSLNALAHSQQHSEDNEIQLNNYSHTCLIVPLYGHNAGTYTDYSLHDGSRDFNISCVLATRQTTHSGHDNTSVLRQQQQQASSRLFSPLHYASTQCSAT